MNLPPSPLKGEKEEDFNVISILKLKLKIT